MEYIVFAMLGLLSGLGFYYLACYQIKVRSTFDPENKGLAIKKPFFRIAWVAIPALLFMGIAAMKMDYWQSCRYMLIVLMAINVAGIDMLIRRIPNALLLGMLILHIANIAIETIGTGNFVNELFDAFLGLVIAYILFVIPGFLKMQIGAGDIKYSAVIGFMMGFYGYMQTMIVMAIAILVYYLYLKITRTGNLKTAAPMAPFLSGGVLATLFIPLI